MPAASLDASVRSRDLGTFWPDLAPAPKTPESASTRTPAFQEDDFKLDPAAAAASVKTADLTDKEVAKVIDLWAPHDLPAARAWLSRVPAGPARQQGELAIAKIQAPYDPVAVLTALTSRRLTADRATRELWSTCLRRITLNGGDWRSWLARMPADTEPRSADLAHSLAAEARLLEVLKQEPAR